MGTLHFKAPEVETGDYGLSVDIYGLGVTAVACGCGPPQALEVWNATEKLEIVLAKWPGAAIIGRMMSPKAEGRPTAGAVLQNQWTGMNFGGASLRHATGQMSLLRAENGALSTQVNALQDRQSVLADFGRIVVAPDFERTSMIADAVFLDNVRLLGPVFCLCAVLANKWKKQACEVGPWPSIATFLYALAAQIDSEKGEGNGRKIVHDALKLSPKGQKTGLRVTYNDCPGKENRSLLPDDKAEDCRQKSWRNSAARLLCEFATRTAEVDLTGGSKDRQVLEAVAAQSFAKNAAFVGVPQDIRNCIVLRLWAAHIASTLGGGG
mmetsp:Transcript_31226/g.67626  ORF Transcript_31226/g.67626 Transcript_31226/m.67626 type:complete len:323 (-) Transcript_31226:285-1253(-)|eukprot:CAMPEP_0178572590 /NCGR_PEP_ID=MMETSP0697-20121206/18302_1 /TAXON_ID=265572 /ORGANISM="Extubocellulus spinifer, Strain CCMP396" /LENGTH=322 /DNA_ID=CAMNT_0020207325 /DNA_START=901 /DNA_END=1869 /DNA_ORIENTATION=-